VIAERSRVDGVHVRKLRHVDEKDAAPKNMLQIGAGSAKDRLHIVQALRCCAAVSGPTSFPVAGSVAPCPDTTMSRSNCMPGE